MSCSGMKPVGHPRELEARERDQPDIDDEDEGRCPNEARGYPGVLRRHPLEASIETPKDALQNSVQASGLSMAVVRLQQHRSERRAQGQRNEAGDHRRGRNGGRELLEEEARDAGDECRRDENRAKSQCDGDKRGRDFAHRLMRGFARRHALRHVAFDVLDHDDRVVDHDAYRQHQTKQRQVVDRDAE